MTMYSEAVFAIQADRRKSRDTLKRKKQKIEMKIEKAKQGILTPKFV